MPTHTRAVLFDMDGVLILSGPAHYEAWKTAAAEDGIALSYGLFAETFGRTNPDVIRMIWTDHAGRTVAPERAAAIADAKERAYRDLVRQNVPLAPGIFGLLDGLAGAGFTLGIGSSAPRENVDLLLDASGLRPRFAAIVDGSMVARGKPAPDVFLQGAALAGLPPSRCAVVEDAPAGIEAARAAGMLAIGVATTHPAADLVAAGAHHVEPALADLSARTFLDRLA
jgi:beta-phosphoglucomutase